MSIIKFRHNLAYYLKLFDMRKDNDDLLGALDAGRNALKLARMRADRESINLLLGQIYYDMGLYTLSCEYYFRALEIASCRASAYFGVGRNLVQLERYVLALEYFDKALEWDVDGGFAECILEWTGYIKKQLNTKQKQNDILHRIKQNIKQGNYVLALQMIKQNVVDGADEIGALLLEAECYLRMHDIDHARIIAKLVLSIEHDNVPARLMMCVICRYDDDETSLYRQLEYFCLDKLNSGELLTIAQLYASMGKYDKALQALMLIQKNLPYSPKVQLYIAICYNNLHDKENALYYLAQARWIDYENPILNDFHQMFEQGKEELVLSDRLPNKRYQQKLKDIHNAISKQNFVALWIHSPILSEQTDWLLCTDEYDEVKQMAQKFCQSPNKRVKKYCAHSLLSVRTNLRQKFLLTREVMRTKYYKIINLNANLTYRSFYNNLPHFCYQNELFKRSVTSARAYVECYANMIDIIPMAKCLYNKIGLMQNNDFDENVLACLMFNNNTQIMEKACRYFDVDIACIENVKNILKLN